MWERKFGKKGGMKKVPFSHINAGWIAFHPARQKAAALTGEQAFSPRPVRASVPFRPSRAGKTGMVRGPPGKTMAGERGFLAFRGGPLAKYEGIGGQEGGEKQLRKQGGFLLTGQGRVSILE